NFDRVEGMMLGLAIGDALGITTESMLPDSRKQKYGEIRDYLPNRYTSEARGFPSDDSQLAYWTLEQINRDQGFTPDNVAQRFCRERIFGIGSTVKKFLKNYKSGKLWYQAGPRSAGNGALMRIAPMLLPHLKSATTKLWVDTALSAMMTHNDSGSTAACLSLINILWQLLERKTPPQPEWWLNMYITVAKELETNLYRPRGGNFTEYEGPIWKFVSEKVTQAYQEGLSVEQACNRWYSGAYLLETVPSVIYILMKHGDNLEEAMVRAVNDTKDNDTIAAIVGTAVGALYGKAQIPVRWLDNLSGRTGLNDDGKMLEILAESGKLWG
ncbi:MAG: ADP-ribosylglycohydrolase, partial [Symploca sp. SIO3E6]|nr:ADP-ribosylglycohydrolase [Caldora sp. SIO3E6]